MKIPRDVAVRYDWSEPKAESSWTRLRADIPRALVHLVFLAPAIYAMSAGQQNHDQLLFLGGAVSAFASYFASLRIATWWGQP